MLVCSNTTTFIYKGSAAGRGSGATSKRITSWNPTSSGLTTTDKNEGELKVIDVKIQ